jgi:tetratricopeptide (TPR) repeat protein
MGGGAHMSELRLDTLTMPAADLGADNPLPPFRSIQDLHEIGVPAGVPADMLRQMQYGRVSSILPYTMQDGCNRQRQPRDFRVAVLENEFLRATFLLELGGRLWSLIHKPSGRNLLYTNPVFQPANLALRNAWFSGGVEWNLGTIGHTPLTCAPLFAARVQAPDGTPVLRLYEWERLRQVTYQIDAYLPAGSQVLLVRVRITNPHEHEMPLYWWSNIAVPETPDTRVLAPADQAYRFSYKEEGLRVVSVPVIDGVDFSYATNSQRAYDLFFHIPDDSRRWITALDGEGRGLVQVSTQNLIGRKLFAWGQGAGGKNWQAFLSQEEQAYIEIQAGLARTQMEHVPMPAKTEWAWLEAYGLMETDPNAVHGSDWARACDAVESQLDKLISRAALDAEFNRSAAFVDLPPVEVLQRGSGWGALERRRREFMHEPPFCNAALVFDDDSLGELQAPWLHLLAHWRFPTTSSAQFVPSYMMQREWYGLLKKALETEQDTSWLAWLHYGIASYQPEDIEEAVEAFQMSLEKEITPWALRNLAALEQQVGHLQGAAELYLSAHHLAPHLLPLTIELGKALLASGQAQRWLDLLNTLPAEHRTHGRLRLLECQAALAISDLARAGDLLNQHFTVADLREGELSLSVLWFEYHEKRLSQQENIPIDDALRARVKREYPVPAAIDFRMAVE